MLFVFVDSLGINGFVCYGTRFDAGDIGNKRVLRKNVVSVRWDVHTQAAAD